jgi:hypothetical protein
MEPMMHRRGRPSIASLTLASLTIAALVLAGTTRTAITAPQPQTSSGALSPAARDGSHDFDFEIGEWSTHVKRLQRPLSGSTTWLEYTGTTIVRGVLGRRANLAELAIEGSAGRIEGAALRLYNPETRQWSVNYFSAAAGTLTAPLFGEFREGRGTFYGQDTFAGRAVLVRFVILKENDDRYRFEQSFSADGGEHWELNWIATDSRRKMP